MNTHSHEFRAEGGERTLRSHRFCMRVALSAVNLFAWIFVFQYFFTRSSSPDQALLQTVLLYSLSQFVIFFATPISARRLRNGIKASMAQGVLLASAAYLSLAVAFSGMLGTHIIVGIFAFVLMRGLYRTLYWIPYQVDALRREPASTSARPFREIIVALMPAVGGLTLTNGLHGMYFILIGAAALLLFSLLILRRVPDRQEGYSWGYTESFSKLLLPRYRGLMTIAFLDGLSGATLLLFWPIAVFLLVGWSYSMLGIVMSATYLVVFFSRTYVRALLRRARLDGSALVHAFLAASSWILRLVVSTPLGIVLVDSYFYTGTQVRGTGIDVLTFEQSADHGSYVDEYTALKEMALAIGKIVICIVGALLALATSLPVIFIGVFAIAALASGVSAFLTRRASEL